jgi:sugar phosphate isomerase/epimerase
MRLGLGSYACSWAIGVPGYPRPPEPLTAGGLIERAQQLGVPLVQICDNLPLEGLPEAELDALRRAASARGVTLEVGTRGTEPERLATYLAVARRLGAGLVRTLLEEPGGADPLAAAEKQLREILPEYERAGVRLALENYERYRCRELAALVERIGSPKLGICLDTVNSLGALEPLPAVLEALLPLTMSLHVKDFTVSRLEHRMGFIVAGAPAGAGRLGIPDLLRALRERGGECSAVLELWTPYRGSIGETVALERRWQEESFAYLRRIMP